MGGSKPTFVPFPTFNQTSPSSAGSLSSVGRCRINPKTCSEASDEFEAIIKKNVEQSQVNVNVEDEELKVNRKKLKKKYMKQGVAMAQSFLSNTLELDTSIIDVEILLDATKIIDSDGCLAACFLDAGCDKIAITGETVQEILQAMNLAGVPKERVVAHFDLSSINIFILESISSDSLLFSFTNTLSVDCSSTNITKDAAFLLMTNLKNIAKSNTILEDLNVNLHISADTNNCEDFVTDMCIYCGAKENISGTVSLIDPNAVQLGMSYAACIRTDRDDGLYTTVVCSRSGEALGLVYSSKDSIVEALKCGRGVYYSRSRNGLWRKGDTSGHYQTLHRIDVDCDGDALRFIVTQRGDDCAAFCHLNTLTCWGEPRGIRHLERTLKSRLKSAPVGSYTKRLFDDGELLRDKLVEEAQELSEAEDKKHVAEELADVLYFAMAKAVKAGISIDDAVAELDKRTRKVTRRKGDSKAFRIDAGNKILEKKL